MKVWEVFGERRLAEDPQVVGSVTVNFPQNRQTRPADPRDAKADVEQLVEAQWLKVLNG